MNDYGLDVKRLQSKQVQKQQGQTQQISGSGVGRAIDKVAKQRGGSNDSNREWEGGGHGYEEDDRSMRRWPYFYLPKPIFFAFST